ncbi:ABC transporter ATP-binding protein [Paenibacillus sambharensis]|uniref:ABC transporter ATP-binding protein n=1 Tax=Paenibacillus sambharensis TaxID=1803190 RepID=A0A2W1L1M2_9BACL|nr:ABC transporter ATP-binding protein [Paenibacillus sambharensis]PZD93276.1 ABC transporter ATP-binding protein [Paenibacillus sambharensis]
MTEHALDIRSVSKQFDGMPVLDNVSITVSEGEFVALLGPSGSGKSTLFQMIGGIMRPEAGDIMVSGRQVTGERGNIAYMPQQASLLPWRTVAANVELALEIGGVPKAAARKETRQWLARVGLGEYADAYPHVLSGGMQQRVSFIRALLSPQPLMCLDEPFGALDALTRMQMQQWLLSIWEENRRSVLLVTHSIEEALLLSDRIVVLSAKPASVLREIPVPFDRPRDERLWSTPLFNEMKEQIYELLKPANGTADTGRA